MKGPLGARIVRLAHRVAATLAVTLLGFVVYMLNNFMGDLAGLTVHRTISVLCFDVTVPLGMSAGQYFMLQFLNEMTTIGKHATDAAKSAASALSASHSNTESRGGGASTMPSAHELVGITTDVGPSEQTQRCPQERDRPAVEEVHHEQVPLPSVGNAGDTELEKLRGRIRDTPSLEFEKFIRDVAAAAAAGCLAGEHKHAGEGDSTVAKIERTASTDMLVPVVLQ